MQTSLLNLVCRDPVISRDGRPFGAGQGNRMRSLDWILPSVVAGAVRSAVGGLAEKEFSKEVAERLLQLEVAGVLPRVGDELYLPVPADAVLEKREPRSNGVLYAARPRPLADNEGVNWGHGAERLRPVQLPEDVAENFKPAQVPAWWPLSQYVRWLLGETIQFDEHFLRNPLAEIRTQTKLSEESGTAEDEKLFTTAALPLRHLPRYKVERSDEVERKTSFTDRFAEVTLSARVSTNNDKYIEQLGNLKLHTMGGERRLVQWTHEPSVDLWKCPSDIENGLRQATRIRMVLATPAIFEQGWKPGWLGDGLHGTPPESVAALKLIGASIPRWQAVSGWSLAKVGKDGVTGPKPTRRMVPAGSVYFFEVQGGADKLAERWLDSVCDDEQDRRDGFGLVTWGLW